MLSIFHTLISLPFGVYLQNPWLIFISAFIFHLFSDTLLHWNIYTGRFKNYPFFWVGADVIGGLLMAWMLMGDALFTLPILAAIAGGNMPDILHGFWDLLKRNEYKKYFRRAAPFFHWHDKLQLETNNVPHGLISQTVLALIALWLVI